MVTPAAGFEGTVALSVTATVRSVATSISAAVSGALDLAVDVAAPRLVAQTRAGGAARETNADALVFRLEFSEPVSGVDRADFAVEGGAGALGANAVDPRNDADTGSGTQPARIYRVTVEGAGLAGHDGEVGLRMVPEAGVADAADNALANTVPDGAGEDYLLDNTGPTVTITAPATHDGSTAFDVTVAAGESGVVGFEADDVEVAGGSEGDSFSGDGETFQGTVTPAGAGHVTVSVPAGAFTDALGNDNLEAERVVAHAATLFVASPEARAFTVGAALDAVELPAASGGDGTYTYALSGPDGGALPAGLSFDATDADADRHAGGGHRGGGGAGVHGHRRRRRHVSGDLRGRRSTLRRSWPRLRTGATRWGCRFRPSPWRRRKGGRRRSGTRWRGLAGGRCRRGCASMRPPGCCRARRRRWARRR